MHAAKELSEDGVGDMVQEPEEAEVPHLDVDLEPEAAELHNYSRRSSLSDRTWSGRIATTQPVKVEFLLKLLRMALQRNRSQVHRNRGQEVRNARGGTCPPAGVNPSTKHAVTNHLQILTKTVS